MEWKVSNALSRDIERQQLNKILAEIQSTVGKLTNTSTGSTKFPNIGGGGISSSYNPSTGTVELSVPDFTINLDGDVTGSGTVSKLSSVTIPTALDPSLIGVKEAPVDNQYYWRINEAWDVVPDSIIAIADLDQEGIAVLWENPETYTFEWVMREIEGTTDQIDVTNGNGITGNPVINLSDIPDTGIGAALVRITRDSKGRIEGTAGADTDDLPEGIINLYHSEERAQIASAAPYYIPLDATFVVYTNQQVLFALPIDVEGVLDINGALVQV